jgi:putative ABC transport system permease protein
LIKKASLFRNSIKEYPGVLGATVSDISVGDDYWVATLIAEMDGQMKAYDLRSMIVDESFSELYQLELIAGRSFDRGKRTDINNCLINEAALLKLGLGSDVINRNIRVRNRDDGKIIGVVKNFYFTSKHNEIEPLFIYLAEEGDYIGTISVKIAPKAIRGTIQNLIDAWNSFSLNEDFEYTLVEDKIKAFYGSEERLSVVLKWGTTLSFIIVGFGLICFILFVIEQRTKEICIRKVNGASTSQIVKAILLNEFLIPATAAILLISSLSQLVVKRFLQYIVTDLSINWWIYIVTIIIILFTLFMTTFHQLYKAANRNPAEVLTKE